MTILVLDGCRSTPLGGYLTSLGLLRAVTRLLDGDAAGAWSRQRFLLDSRFTTVDDLADEMLARFEPEAIVSPWNAGSGFANNGRNPTAEAALQQVRDSSDPRMSRLRVAVLAGDHIVAEGRRRGWGGKGDELWDKARKVDVLRLCRNEFPDDALSWVDAAVALGKDADPTYSRLLGTGGNFGRQDLSITYLQRAASVWQDRRSRKWLVAVLTGDESVPYLRDSVGQFDPGRAGGVQSSPWEKADDKGFVNPWAFLLTVEGALLFATAMVRRHGAEQEHSRAALPFQVRGSAAGFGTAATQESPLGELWAPEWASLARLDEVTHLLAEGRAEWNGRSARSGLEFARAVATLGVDRGITAFERHVFVDRHGQSPLALPAGRVEVGPRGGVDLLAPLDSWLDALRRADLPSGPAARLRAVEHAIFIHARDGAAARLVEVFEAVGRLNEILARSGAGRAAAGPLVIPRGADLLAWLDPAVPNDPELRIALALATARDGNDTATASGLRPLLQPLAAEAGWPRWTNRPVQVPPGMGIMAALAEAARRRGFPGAVPNPAADETPPAVRGVRIAFARGLRLRTGDIGRLVAGALDERRAANLLHGLLTVDWRGLGDTALPCQHPVADPAVHLLLLYAGTTGLWVPGDDGALREVVLRPGSEWPSLLAAGRNAAVLVDAARRLRIAGLRHVVDPTDTPHDGARLAAALLLRATDEDRHAALRRIAVVPDPRPTSQDEEIPA